MVVFVCYGFWEFYMNFFVFKNVKNVLVICLGFYI